MSAVEYASVENMRKLEEKSTSSGSPAVPHEDRARRATRTPTRSGAPRSAATRTTSQRRGDRRSIDGLVAEDPRRRTFGYDAHAGSRGPRRRRTGPRPPLCERGPGLIAPARRRDEPTRSGVIGWGSLLWDPRSLPMSGAFRDDGPRLPIEFSRVAQDGRVTLVIDPHAEPVATYWVKLDVTDLAGAVTGLGRRERIAPARWAEWVGAQTRSHPQGDRGEASAETRAEVARWLEGQDLEAVVWTALPKRRPDGAFGRSSLDELVTHLRGLEGDAAARAEEYVRRAPPAIRTAHRRRFEAEFGWTISDAPPNPATPGVPE